MKIGRESCGDLTSDFIQQAGDTTCAIRSQEIILRDFGINVPEETLVDISQKLGLFNGHGTNPQDVGKLLDFFGVGVSQYSNTNVEHLVKELAQGKRIIVGVDSKELQNPLYRDFFSGREADHALIVGGIDTSDINNIKVILTDPGTGHIAKEYPIDQFLDAWNDSGNFMVSTNAPAPIDAMGMINFDYQTGHIPFIDGFPFDKWVESNYVFFEPPDFVSNFTLSDDFFKMTNNQFSTHDVYNYTENQSYGNISYNEEIETDESDFLVQSADETPINEIDFDTDSSEGFFDSILDFFLDD